LITGGLAACAIEEPVPTPTVVWVDGAPTGPLEADPWVRAVRAGDLAYVLAHNAADFSGEDLLTTWHEYTVMKFVQQARGDVMYDQVEVFLGPGPFTPLDVVVADDGRSAKVVGCVGPHDVQQEVVTRDRNRWPTVLTYVVDLSDDGRRRIRGAAVPHPAHVLPDGTALTAEHCDTVLIKRAVLDPPPDLGTLAAKSRDDVVLPPSPSPTPAP